MNRKGLELIGKEMLQIIIAIICILVLVYFLVSLYTAHLRNKELEQAKASLEHLISEINSGREQVEIYNPAGWDISSFKKPKEIPNQCSNAGWESCICICQAAGRGAIKTTLNACNVALGICKESDFVVKGPVWTNTIPIGCGLVNVPLTRCKEKLPLTLTIGYEDENKIIQKKTGAEDEEGEAFGGAGGRRGY